MNQASKTMAELNKGFQEHASKLATASLAKAERLAKFNLASSRVVIKQAVYTTQMLAAAKDAAAISSLQAELAETAVRNLQIYSRGIYQVAADTHADFSKLVEDAWAVWPQSVTAWVEDSAKDSPAGERILVDVLKSAVAATSAAFDQYAQANWRVARLADKVVHMVTASVVSVA